MRDLTLRSAQSFGSFHLIRLLFDEYIFYLVEQRIAKTTHTTPLQMLGEVCYNNNNNNSYQITIGFNHYIDILIACIESSRKKHFDYGHFQYINNTNQ